MKSNSDLLIYSGARIELERLSMEDLSDAAGILAAHRHKGLSEKLLFSRS